MAIRALVWGENVHEQTNAVVRAHLSGRHALRPSPPRSTRTRASRPHTATLQEPEHGLTEARLAETDVLVWWGHAAHGKVDDAIVERVQHRVWEGMGLIVLHSGAFLEDLQAADGHALLLKWREAGERERIWVVNPQPSDRRRLGEFLELPNSEMYGEPFTVPEPLETVFISWFQGGEVFRSGLTFQRGAGRIFYFSPGHETYPIYHHPGIRQVLRNAVHWARPQAEPWTTIAEAPNVPMAKAREPLVETGPKIHRPGKSGLA